MIHGLFTLRAVLILIGGLAIFSAGCSVFDSDDDGEGNADGASVRTVLLTSDVDANGQPINPRNLFAPSVREIRATVGIVGAKPGMEVTGTWYQLGTANAGAQGQQITSADAVLEADAIQNGNSVVSFALGAGGSGLPEDSWLLRVFINDELVRTTGFVVSRAAGAAAPTTAPAPTPTPVAYTVAAGDTLASIAQRFLPQGQNVTDFSNRIATFNNLAAGATLTAGQVIRIPPNQ